MTDTQTLNVIGLAVNATGVLLLFRYGMPYRVMSGEGEFIITESVRPEAQRLDRRYRMIGWLGLVLILLGTGLQIGATVSA